MTALQQKVADLGAGATGYFTPLCCPAGYTALAISVALKYAPTGALLQALNTVDTPTSPGCFRRFIENMDPAAYATEMDSTLACARIQAREAPQSAGAGAMTNPASTALRIAASASSAVAPTAAAASAGSRPSWTTFTAKRRSSVARR